MFFAARKSTMIDAASALPGRAEPLPTAQRHLVNGNPSAASILRS